MTKMLVLRASSPSGTSHGGFVWPQSGPVEAPDWDSVPLCGGGLHGWLWGEGDVHASSWANDPDAVWQIVEVESEVVDLGGKVKFPRGVVVASGSRSEICAEMSRRCPGRSVIYGTATAGAYGTATAGAYGTATVGAYGTATVGDGGTATASHRGKAQAGDGGTATVGAYGTATVGAYGTATAGHGGTVILSLPGGGALAAPSVDCVPFVERDERVVADICDCTTACDCTASLLRGLLEEGVLVPGAWTEWCE